MKRDIARLNGHIPINALNNFALDNRRMAISFDVIKDLQKSIGVKEK